MKTNVFTCLVLTLFFLSSFNPLSMHAQFCETFDFGQGTWMGVDANVGTMTDSTGNISLDVDDASGESWVING
ncbi:MAG: hypothetical protein KDC44_20295, partial [Phaeodactylibacter sp.]|nr:hypothetical protein [Phaeodactylibacter sp.]